MQWRAGDFAVIGLLAVLATATALMQQAPRDPRLAQDDMAIRQTIGAQIEAFQAGRHAMAFSYASPALQDQFGTVDAFITMVQAHYRPVYRAQSFAFTGAAKPIAAHRNMRIQLVFITDETGTGHRARYFMQKQPDGSWKIAGCHLLSTPEIEI